MNDSAHSSRALLANALLGLASPLDCLRFMRSKKSLLVMGLAPYVIAFILYLVLIGKNVSPVLMGFLIDRDLLPAQDGFSHSLVSAVIWLLALTVFSLVGPSVISTLASPLYDHLSSKTYVHFSGRSLPSETIIQYFRSFIGECTKLVLWLMVIVVIAATPFAAPLGAPIALWFLGWTHIDRTLNLQALTLKSRLIFGLENAPACFGLGLWSLIPGFNTLFTFMMASAGAIIVAKVEQPDKSPKSPDDGIA